MQNGFEAIVKTPCQIAGPRYLAPLVKRYSSSDEIPVGTEYIIMERAAGRERHKLASESVEMETKFFSLPFQTAGDEASTDSKTFCIGPTADYMFGRGKRASLDISRGPWADPCSFLMSIAQKEIEWVRQYGKPSKLDFPHNGSTPGEASPDEYIHLLEKFPLLAPYLLPRDSDNPLNQLTLRHPVGPRLPVAGHPCAFENPDIEQSPDLKEPSLHSDYNTLPAQEKVEADELYRRRLLFYYYRIFNGHLNKPHLQALSRPYLFAPSTPRIKCPVEFTDAELEVFAKQEQMWFYLSKLVNYWRDEIGINEDGWISNDGYEDAVRKAGQLKDSLVEAAEGDEKDISLLNEGWMFRDREEID
ncbi:hypothetical protein BDV33DRAFT_226912 [Aspergillus novoparasiticus]|uniref:Uncharacterized protein n=1 Tax=Aspergillus novoparasiticus TaxID=986946 RepID=A0A5N6F960_9EURO|nr:hypothetical protein BDV33DRAFT_226912 [Aspergillus novoparasiticus]